MSEDNEAAAIAAVAGDSGARELSDDTSATEVAIAKANTSNLQQSPPELPENFGESYALDLQKSPSELPENIDVGESCEQIDKQSISNDDDELSATERNKKEKRRRKKSRRRKKRNRQALVQAMIVEKPIVGGTQTRIFLFIVFGSITLLAVVLWVVLFLTEDNAKDQKSDFFSNSEFTEAPERNGGFRLTTTRPRFITRAFAPYLVLYDAGQTVTPTGSLVSSQISGWSTILSFAAFVAMKLNRTLVTPCVDQTGRLCACRGQKVVPVSYYLNLSHWPSFGASGWDIISFKEFVQSRVPGLPRGGTAAIIHQDKGFPWLEEKATARMSTELRLKAAVQDPIILAELCGSSSEDRRQLRWGGYLRGQKHIRFHDGQSSCKISNVMPLANEVLQKVMLVRKCKGPKIRRCKPISISRNLVVVVDGYNSASVLHLFDDLGHRAQGSGRSWISKNDALDGFVSTVDFHPRVYREAFAAMENILSSIPSKVNKPDASTQVPSVTDLNRVLNIAVFEWRLDDWMVAHPLRGVANQWLSSNLPAIKKALRAVATSISSFKSRHPDTTAMLMTDLFAEPSSEIHVQVATLAQHYLLDSKLALALRPHNQSPNAVQLELWNRVLATSAAHYTTCSHMCLGDTNTKPGTVVDGKVEQVNTLCGNSSTFAVSVPAEIMKVRAKKGLTSVLNCRFMSGAETSA